MPQCRLSVCLSVQVAIGYVGDRPSVDTLAFYNLMTSMAGLAVLLVPLVTSFPALAAASALYGLFVSANYALTTVILIELVGFERLTDAVGIISFAQGIANLVGPPLAGTYNGYKLEFHDADTGTDILAGILADTSDTRDFLKLFLWHADIFVTILARMSVSVSAPWNASYKKRTYYLIGLL